MSDVDWKFVVSASLHAGILSLLTSVATGLPEVKAAQVASMYVTEPEDSSCAEIYSEEQVAAIRAEMEGDEDDI
jgi:hypothetical protein